MPISSSFRASLLLRLTVAAATAPAGCGGPESAQERPAASATGEGGLDASAAASAPTPSSAASAEAPGDAPPTASAATPADVGKAHPGPAGMVRVPEGIYLMGSPIGGSFEERPMHEVVVAAFWFDRTEVTMRAYAACVAAGACPAPAKDNPFCNAHFEDRDEHPVNCVDWNAADAYCKHVGKRLPTEREWEYAARGGSERRTFSWGEEPADEARSCYRHPGGSCPVGSFPPGAFDLLDMNGNVWEWTSSWYGTYPDELATGQFKVYRGGSWSRRFPKWLRNELRNRYRTDKHSASLGIRCARTVEPLVCPPESAPSEGGCVRVTGDPTCEAGFGWNGKVCAPGAGGVTPVGVDPKAPRPDGGQAPSPSDASAAPSASGPDAAPDTFVRSRTPQHDGDCQKNWPTTPAAYRWDGGTFHTRNKPIAAAGCQKRDMGRTWTSACCKG